MQQFGASVHVCLEQQSLSTGVFFSFSIMLQVGENFARHLPIFKSPKSNEDMS